MKSDRRSSAFGRVVKELSKRANLKRQSKLQNLEVAFAKLMSPFTSKSLISLPPSPERQVFAREFGI